MRRRPRIAGRSVSPVARAGVALVGVPSSAGARRTGLEKGPAAFRSAGLPERLRSRGVDVLDLGDLPAVPFRPDPEHPRTRNLPLVAAVAHRVANRVDEASKTGRLPLVLGGDCSISLGVVSGLLSDHPELGLVYFDGDLDLNTPETTPSGAFDGMVLAHLLGRGARELSGIGPRRPLLAEEDVVVFGYDVGSGWIDPPEIEALGTSALARFPRSRVVPDPAGAAEEALAVAGRRSKPIVVHFDVDVMDFPATDVPHPGGLEVETALAALRVFVAAPACVGVVVSELNAERDPDGTHTRRLVSALVEVFAERGAERGR